MGPDLGLMGNVLSGACLPSHPPLNPFSLIPCSRSCLLLGWEGSAFQWQGSTSRRQGTVFSSCGHFHREPGPQTGHCAPFCLSVSIGVGSRCDFIDVFFNIFRKVYRHCGHMHLHMALLSSSQFPLGPFSPSSSPSEMPFVLNLRGGAPCFLLLTLPVTTS